MDSQAFLEDAIKAPVFAAVRKNRDISRAIASPVKTIFLLSGSIGTIADACCQIEQTGRHCLIHVDLIDGLRPDQQGIEFLAASARPTGIITTKPACVKWAKNLGLLTVQRIFMLDSTALQEGARHVEACRPDLVEVMPGVALKAIRLAARAFQCPLIAGGLISEREEVQAALAAGAIAVSTSEPTLWY